MCTGSHKIYFKVRLEHKSRRGPQNETESAYSTRNLKVKKLVVIESFEVPREFNRQIWKVLVESQQIK